MDALEFIRERKRMCKFYYDEEKGYCPDKCPAHYLDCVSLDQPEENIKCIIGVVEAWSAFHPIKTRQSAFLEQHPKAKVDNQNVLCVCPAYIYSDMACSNTVGVSCFDCRREFWLEEVE